VPDKLRQERFWDWENPLQAERWKPFFDGLPARCGVYQFRSTEGQVLYVGQSKNLRNRLKSYRSVHPERSSRKLLRMVREVETIEVEVCESEEKTRALEAMRIHELRPKHNRVFTHPESHRYLEFRWIDQDRWKWTILSDLSDRELAKNTWVFGAFPGSAVRQLLSSIRRIETFHKRRTMTQAETPFGFFDPMVPDVSQVDFRLEPNLTAKECERLLRKVVEYFEGKSDHWLHRVYGKSGQCIQQSIDPWLQSYWLQDFDRLQRFFKYQCRRNREFANRFPISRKQPIGAHQLDLLKARAQGAASPRTLDDL